MKIKECMCDNVMWLKPEDTIAECAKLMCKTHIGSVPICDDNQKVVGFVTDRDILLRAVACDKDTCNVKLSDIMTTNVCCCDANNEVEAATKMMADNHIRRIPIVENDKIVGILTLGDLAQNDSISDKKVITALENICKCDNKNAE